MLVSDLNAFDSPIARDPFGSPGRPVDTPLLADPVRTASGARLITQSGREYLDFAHGVLFYQHPQLVQEASAALDRMPLSSRMFFSAPLAQLTSRLSRLVWDDVAVAYPCNSPSEAMEGALKLALGAHRGQRHVFLTLPNSSHGATAGALSISDTPELNVRGWRAKPILDSRVAEIEALPGTVDRSVAAVVVEPVQRTLGMAPLPPGFLREVRKACSRSGALLIVNETLTAFGRLGHWLACRPDERTAAVADVVVLGETLGGSLMPYGAYVARTWLNARVYNRVNPALHGGTTAGHPLGCRIALAVIDLLESERVVERTRALGFVLRADLSRLARDFGTSVTGHVATGLTGALRLRSARHVEDVRQACAREGVWLGRCGGDEQEWLTILPPILVSPSELRDGLARVRAGLAATLPSDGDARI